MSEEERFEIVPGSNRGLHLRKRRPRRFGERAKKAFVEHLAATCNAQASAAAAGVHVSTVYNHRMREPGFAADWDAALAQGYARLEAALLERAARGAERGGSTGAAAAADADAPAALSFEQTMQLMSHHRRGMAGLTARGRLVPKRVAIDQVAEKLIRKFRALGVDPGQGGGGGEGEAR